MEIENNKFFNLTVVFLIIAIIGIVSFVTYQNYFIIGQVLGEKVVEENLNCIEEEQSRIVKGNSLHGIIENGEMVKILKNYYNCNEIQRDDVINYQYTSNKNSIIKIVKAIPGDDFKLQKNEQGNYNILVNNQILTISTGEPYELTENKKQMLALYERDYKGKIPQDVYLILGNVVSGTLDSTRFGLISKNGIIGKVIKNN